MNTMIDALLTGLLFIAIAAGIVAATFLVLIISAMAAQKSERKPRASDTSRTLTGLDARDRSEFVTRDVPMLNEDGVAEVMIDGLWERRN